MTLEEQKQSQLEYAREVAYKEGYKEGFAEGLVESGNISILIAKRMLDNGMDIDLIVEVTKLKEDIVRALVP